MKKVLNRVLSVVLSLVMCVSVLNLTVFAADDTTTPDAEPTESTEVVEQHTHNAQKLDSDGKTVLGTWVCTVTYVDDGDCTLTAHTHSAACEGNAGFEIVCGMRVHTHTDACYTEKEVEVEVPVLDAEGNPVLDAEGNPTTTTETQTKRELTCPLTEHKEHVDSCYTCDTPEHTHGENGAGCQFAQKEVWTCEFKEKESNEVTEDGKVPEKDGGYKVTDTQNIYVYIEPDSIEDYDPNGTANGHSYMTLAKIEITEGLLKAYNNGKDTSSPLYIADGTKSDGLSPEQFNALVNFALKNDGAKDKDGNPVSVDDKKVDNINWVYVKGSNGATDFNVSWDQGTVHADGHAHRLEVVPNAEGSPTCTEGGYITYRCTKPIGTEYLLDDTQHPVIDKDGNLVVKTPGAACGYTMKVYSAPLGHDFSKSTWANNGDGTHSKQCSRCAEKMTQAHNWVEKSAWTEWTEVKGDPTTLERTRVLKCADGCGVADKTESQTKKLGQYVLTYVCKAGDEVIGSGTVGAFYPGEDYSQGAPAITGYTATTGTQTGKMPSEDYVLEFAYTVKEYTLTINYLYASTNTVAAAQYTGTVAYKANYSVASPTVTGYTTTTTTVSGTMPADDVVVNVYYSAIPVPPTPPTPPTPPEQEIDEPDVPLVEEPDVDIEEPEVPLVEEPEIEIEIEEPDVPLADVPETGDGSGLWFMSAVLSAMGLALLFFTRKREGQEG